MKSITINNLQEMEEFAAIFSKKLKGSEVICLNGELGAGKTTFTQALAKNLEVTKTVNSPTFVIMKVYNTLDLNIKKLIHIDAYRLNSGNDILNIGANEYFNQPNTITIIEWPEKIKSVLPKNCLYINFKFINNETRELTLA